MRRGAGVGILAFVFAGCAHMSDLTVSTTPPGAGAGSGFRELTPAAAWELTKAFRDDPATAQAKYAKVRWRFPGTIQTVGQGMSVVSVEGIGDCTLAWRPETPAPNLQPKQSSEFAGVVESFNPSVVGGVKFRNTEQVSRKVRSPDEGKWESPVGDS